LHYFLSNFAVVRVVGLIVVIDVVLIVFVILVVVVVVIVFIVVVVVVVVVVMVVAMVLMPLMVFSSGGGAHCTVPCDGGKIDFLLMHFAQISTYHHHRVKNRIQVDDFSQTQLFLINNKIRIQQFKIFKISSI
jgi:hypothetical protein